ncbi:Enoyl-[acyl-carrier-protein] reductase [Fulvivirga imtechensis AK7]|uniref:Enoyl-[acyl-carrier-protein] reductase n=1 Tax=Fulvivirga imtechensis AK7 TaxID=1237149 RepID=L8JU30_9BACT|nr:nitronate monooxygenase [Fulvivirga imtechensis]ELR71059.1 Enoyl-[acyl-carrier-protein] reductase [Fulvivirga imtechensis AK7]
MENRINKLFKIQYPIVQAGMVWCSGWRLASAVSNAGGLGLIGSGSMYPEVLREHIQKCQKATQKPFGVNVPLLYPDIDLLMKVIIEEGVKIVFTSAGNPKTWTATLQAEGVTVVHVVSSIKFAKKCEEVGVDAVVAEGFEAGGHNGREETTTFCLLPMIREAISVPLIAAGGVATGRSMLGAMALGADGVQVGSRFAVSEESSAHPNFKQKVVDSQEGDTILTLKELAPVRLIKNKFYETVRNAEALGASREELMAILGKRRSRLGIFEGNLEEGELEIGQISAAINDVLPAGKILINIWEEYVQLKEAFCQKNRI